MLKVSHFKSVESFNTQVISSASFFLMFMYTDIEMAKT